MAFLLDHPWALWVFSSFTKGRSGAPLPALTSGLWGSCPIGPRPPRMRASSVGLAPGCAVGTVAPCTMSVCTVLTSGSFPCLASSRTRCPCQSCPPGGTRRASADAWHTASSWVPLSCRRTGPTPPRTPTSRWPSIPRPCSSTASRPASCTRSCSSPASATCVTCASWTPSGCTRPPPTSSGRSWGLPGTEPPWCQKLGRSRPRCDL